MINMDTNEQAATAPNTETKGPHGFRDSSRLATVGDLKGSGGKAVGGQIEVFVNPTDEDLMRVVSETRIPREERAAGEGSKSSVI